MKQNKFYWSIQTKPLLRHDALAIRDSIRKGHFLPRDRFKLIMDHGRFRVVCKIYHREIPRFEFRELNKQLALLRRNTIKVEKWRKKNGGCAR